MVGTGKDISYLSQLCQPACSKPCLRDPIFEILNIAVRLGAQVKKLQDRMEKLRLENKRYRETNRTAEFEAAVAALQQQVREP